MPQSIPASFNTLLNTSKCPFELQFSLHKCPIPSWCRPECDEYIRIFEYSNILGTNIYSDIHSGQFCLYEYIRTFVRVKFVCTNIFRHSFMSVLESENRPNIRIFVQFSIQIFIRTFVRVKFVIQIYSDKHLCENFHKFHTLHCMFVLQGGSKVDEQKG